MGLPGFKGSKQIFTVRPKRLTAFEWEPKKTTAMWLLGSSETMFITSLWDTTWRHQQALIKDLQWRPLTEICFAAKSL